LRDPHIRVSREVIAKSLCGDWRAEHLFTLRQSQTLWQAHQEQVEQCDAEIARMLAQFDAQTNQPLPEARTPNRSTRAFQPGFNPREECHRVLGVDLTAVPGFQAPTVRVLLGELGPGFAEKFTTAKHFASWLGLCPDNRITGAKIYSLSTRPVKSRVAEALRLAAQSLSRAQTYFGDLFRRWKARLGSPKAITAMAHKLARILWQLLKYKEPFKPEVFALQEQQLQRKKLHPLHNMAIALNFKLVPNQ